MKNLLNDFVKNINKEIKNDNSTNYCDSFNTNGAISQILKICGSNEQFAFAISSHPNEYYSDIAFVSEDNQSPFHGRYYLQIIFTTSVWKLLFPDKNNTDILKTVSNYNRKEKIDLIFRLKNSLELLKLKNERSELFREANRLNTKIRKLEKSINIKKELK